MNDPTQIPFVTTSQWFIAVLILSAIGFVTWYIKFKIGEQEKRSDTANMLHRQEHKYINIRIDALVEAVGASSNGNGANIINTYKKTVEQKIDEENFKQGK